VAGRGGGLREPRAAWASRATPPPAMRRANLRMLHSVEPAWRTEKRGGNVANGWIDRVVCIMCTYIYYPSRFVKPPSRPPGVFSGGTSAIAAASLRRRSRDLHLGHTSPVYDYRIPGLDGVGVCSGLRYAESRPPDRQLRRRLSMRERRGTRFDPHTLPSRYVETHGS
jgi:hypothetical protein